MSAERGRDVVSWKLVFPPPLNACGETVSLDYRRGAAHHLRSQREEGANIRQTFGRDGCLFSCNKVGGARPFV